MPKYENKNHTNSPQINTMFTPATRIQQTTEYYFSRKLKEIALRNANGENIINLAIGNPDLPPTEQTINTLCLEAQKNNAHGYQPYNGTPELRNALSKWYENTYNTTLDPNNEILPLMGSKEGILHVTLALINPEDGVLVPNPGYPTYTALSNLLGAKVSHYNLTEENNWQINFDELEKQDLSKIKLMWVNYPHMPTGANPHKDLFPKLVAFAKKHNIIIANDNPYSLILNDNPTSIFQTPGAKECCIELNSLSKSHNIAGWRIGMVASNPQFINWILKAKSNIDSGMFKAMQLAAVEALNAPEEWHKMNNETYKERREFATHIVKQLGCTYDPTQVGLFIWAKIPDTYPNCEALTDLILEKAKVFITPGSIFGSQGERFIRIALCSDIKIMKTALQRIIEIQ